MTTLIKKNVSNLFCAVENSDITKLKEYFKDEVYRNMIYETNDNCDCLLSVAVKVLNHSYQDVHSDAFDVIRLLLENKMSCNNVNSYTLFSPIGLAVNNNIIDYSIALVDLFFKYNTHHSIDVNQLQGQVKKSLLYIATENNNSANG